MTSLPSSAAGDEAVEAVDAPAPSEVAVLLVTYQSEDDLPALFASLPGAVAPHRVRVVAVDNASRDRSVELVREHGGEVVANPTNAGLARAINQAAAAAGSAAEWLLIVNPDTVLPAGSIAHLVAAGGADPTIGAIGPRITTPAGEDYPTGRRFPSVGAGIAHALLARVWPDNPGTRAYLASGNGEGDVDWLSGACVLVRRAAFDAIGGWDTAYFMYFEETDACLRLHRAGWRVVLDGGAAITHREGGSWRSAPVRKVVNHHRSALIFYRRLHAGTPWILLTPLVAAGLAVRAAAVALRTALRGPEVAAPLTAPPA